MFGYQELGWWGVQLLPRFSHQPGPISKPKCVYSSSQPTLGCLTGISSFQGLYRAPSSFSSPATSPIFPLLSSQARNFGVFRCLFFHIPQPVCQVLSQQRLQFSEFDHFSTSLPNRLLCQPSPVLKALLLWPPSQLFLEQGSHPPAHRWLTSAHREQPSPHNCQASVNWAPRPLPPPSVTLAAPAQWLPTLHLECVMCSSLIGFALWTVWSGFQGIGSLPHLLQDFLQKSYAKFVPPTALTLVFALCTPP